MLIGKGCTVIRSEGSISQRLSMRIIEKFVTFCKYERQLVSNYYEILSFETLTSLTFVSAFFHKNVKDRSGNWFGFEILFKLPKDPPVDK